MFSLSKEAPYAKYVKNATFCHVDNYFSFF